MSSALVLLGLGSAFGAVMLVSVSMQTSRQVRKRSEALLQTQVGDVTVPDQRAEQLAKPLAERIALPVIGALGAIGRRITRKDTRERLTRKLTLAGSPTGWDADKLVAFKAVALGGMLLIGWMLSKAAHFHGIVGTGMPFVMGATGYAIPGAWTVRDSRIGREKGLGSANRRQLDGDERSAVYRIHNCSTSQSATTLTPAFASSACERRKRKA